MSLDIAQRTDMSGSSESALIGLAKLMRMAFSGADLAPLGMELLREAGDDPAKADANVLMDLSTVLQLRGERELALSMQMQALSAQQIYSPPTVKQRVAIRLLAIMGPGDLMANTPLEFLLEDSDVALDLFYVAPGIPLPDTLPEHDLLFVAIGESAQNQPLLQRIEAAVASWPHPVLNLPARIAQLSRDSVCALLQGQPGIVIPDTVRVSRQVLEKIAAAQADVHGVLGDGTFPIIARPVDSHAGQGLARLEDAVAVADYLRGMPQGEFYIARYVDYRSADGLFRKYRIVLIEGKPYACHMAISSEWMIHYLNAGMAEGAQKRAEEARFMEEFDTGFACRHAIALAAIHACMGLDYVGMDCAESADGRLLIFEVDSNMLVHAMDPPEVFPYKQVQMRKVFAAFRSMLSNALGRGYVSEKMMLSSPVPCAEHATAQAELTERLLAAGGDARIALDSSGVNRYGFAPLPIPTLLAFGSCTASAISEQGFAAAERLCGKLLQELQNEPEQRIYAREMERIRQEFVSLCGLADLAGLEVVVAASGTDAHLIASCLFASARSSPVLAITVEAAETGSGVPLALAARHFSSRAASGAMVVEGVGIHAPGEADTVGIDVVTVAVRHSDGSLRPGADIDKEFTAWVRKGCAEGRHVLLVLSDVSKSGLIAPGTAAALALKNEFPLQIEVLVDACQFRIGAQTLCAYLEQDCMVALTGSKFLGGPPFSGALLLPLGVADRLRARPVPRALAAYTSAADWPPGWDTQGLVAAPNPGLLLRWEAALHELRMFRALAETDVTDFLCTFEHAIRQRLADDATFMELPVPVLERSGLGVAPSWDVHQTIFPFLLLHVDGVPLSRKETRQVYLLLQKDLGKLAGSGDEPGLAQLRCQLGQPVVCGEHGGVAVSALRLCISAGLVVEAVRVIGKDAVIAQAMATFDKTAWLTRRIRAIGRNAT